MRKVACSARSTGLPSAPRFVGTIETEGEQLSYPNCERVIRGSLLFRRRHLSPE